MKPQAAQVLRRLKAAGARGVHTNELRRDPEGFIADPPTRVSELRKLGHEITSRPENRGRRYTLLSSPAVAAVPHTADPRVPGASRPRYQRSAEPRSLTPLYDFTGPECVIRSVEWEGPAPMLVDDALADPDFMALCREDTKAAA